MSTQIAEYYDIVSQLPQGSSVTFRDVSWDQYEELLEQVGEAPGLRISYDNGSLQIVTISSEHERYALFLNSLITCITLRLRSNILSFGSATMRKRKLGKGNEPDACYYVQSAPVIGNRVHLDFEADPPPDIVVEIDVHQDSRSKFPIYLALGIPEIWRYDGQIMTIHCSSEDTEGMQYVPNSRSKALPILTATLLTEMFELLKKDGELSALLAFDEWLHHSK